MTLGNVAAACVIVECVALVAVAGWRSMRSRLDAAATSTPHDALDGRTEGVLERLVRAVRPPATPSVTPAAVVLPLDLEQRALEESEPWAREQVRGAYRDAFTADGSWDAVRLHVLEGRL